MKTLLISFLMCSLSISLLAQRRLNSQYYLNRISFFKGVDPMMYESRLLESIDGHEVSRVEKTTQYGRKSEKVVYELNAAQRPIRIERPNSVTTISYFADTLVHVYAVQRKQPVVTTYNYSDGRLALSETFVGDRLTSRTSVQYNEAGKVIFSQVQSQGAIRGGSYSMLYSYEGTDLKQQRFMKNSRVLKRWDYSCKPEGEAINSKTEAQVCNYREESADGSYIQYSRKEEGGKVRLYKHFHNSDSLNYRSECWENDDHLEWVAEKSREKEVYTQYNKHDKVDYVRTIEYNANHLMTGITIDRKGDSKKASRFEYDYNDEGFLTLEKYVYKGKVSKETHYKYVR